MTGFPFALVGFDLDGTLVDSHRDLAEALNHALALDGRSPIAFGHVRDLVGGGARTLLARALEGQGDPPAQDRFEVLLDALLAHYEANLSVHTRPFPGAIAALDDLTERGVAVAVVTNKLERFAVKLLDDLGLAGRFCTIIGGDTLGAGRAKPRPDLLHEMQRRAGIDGRAAYVGDSSFDTGAAHAAGLPCVVCSFGFNDRPAHELGGDVVIDHFGQLVPALLAL